MNGTASEIAPLSRESSAAIIAEQLRAGIARGLFTPGQQLGEVQLAQQFGVSRGLLREAMQRLVQEGLLRSERYRGLFVVDLADEDIRDIYRAREAIEQSAVRAVLEREQVDLEPLTKIMRAMRSAVKRRRGPSLAELDLRFHAALVEASASPRLQRVMNSLVVETAMCQRALESRYRDQRDRVVEHEQILAALVERDRDRALQLVSVHMCDAVARLVERSRTEHGTA